MNLTSPRGRRRALASLAVAVGLSLPLHAAHAAWSVDPVQVRATTSLCPAVAAIDDGHAGAYIAWQENGLSGGVILAQHLLASGDLDPAWTAPTLVCDRVADRSVLGAVSAGAGGAYFWWMEGAYLYIQRVTRIGTIAPGWSSGGRALWQLPTAAFRPTLVPDGVAGVYVGSLWSELPGQTGSYVAIRVGHLNVSGGVVAGWPANGREFGSIRNSLYTPTVSSFGLDADPGGGLWLAWQRLGASADPPGSGDLRVLRLTQAGLPAPGWTAAGDSLGAFYETFPGAGFPEAPQSAPNGSQVAVGHDEAGGAFVLSRQPSFDQLTLENLFQNVLRHVDGLGAAAPGWGPAGETLSDGPEYITEAPSAEASVRAIADRRGGVLTGLPFYGSESTAGMGFSRRDAAGASVPGGVDGAQKGLEVAARGDGGMFVASFKPSDATGPYEADAYISVVQSDPGVGFFESKPSLYDTRYGDIGLTATGDGGAIFAWSQLIDRQGIFAIRLGPAGAVTGVPPTHVVGAPSLRARFIRGEGVHALASMPGPSRVQLSLYDITGRRLASVTRDGTQGGDVVLPGTRGLAGGVYFARATDGTRDLQARVIVLP